MKKGINKKDKDKCGKMSAMKCPLKNSSASSLKKGYPDPSFYLSNKFFSLNMQFEKRLCSIYVVKVLRNFHFTTYMQFA